MTIRWFKELGEVFSRVEVYDGKGKLLSLEEAIRLVRELIRRRKKRGNKIIFIGNGGSASIASHMAVDFWKNATVPAVAFNDASLLTCISNDFGYEYVFQKPIEMFAKKGDSLFAISSSGKSKNILRAAQAAKKIGCFVISMSGFSPRNPLKRCGDINFYVPSDSYGFVETTHAAICHCVLDSMLPRGHKK